jgi:hypothetical protein
MTDNAPWIQTYTGKKLQFQTPQLDQIELLDIAHSLSLICRFSGQIKTFYSVAQHCVLGAAKAEKEYKDKELAKWFLLHDAAEAYMGDMSAPVKRLLRIEDENTKEKFSLFDAYEERVASVIYRRFGLDLAEFPKYQERVNEIDLRMLYTERNQLMKHFKSSEWGDQFEPFKMKIAPWAPAVAESSYEKAFASLFTS